MNLRHIEFVVAAAAEHSFTRAAERCHVTQPTLSNGISLLETELGGQLFIRTTRKVQLSPFGERMLPMVQELYRSHQELKAGAEAFYNPAHRMIKIGLSPLVDVRRVTEALEPWNRANRGCQNLLKECFLDDLDERLRTGQLDMIIVPRQQQRATKLKSVETQPFYSEDLYYLQRSALDSPSADQRNVTLKRIADDTFVLGPDGCGLAATIRKLFKSAGLHLNEYPGQALSYQVMQDWADLGIGSTILPASKIAVEFRPRARRILIRGKRPAVVAYQAMWMRQVAYPNPAIRLHEHFRNMVQRHG